ncbi:MAG: hypothetical protein DMF43_01920 [Verrucomicrobia bacterium]|jgi:hypothetical protein|nr:MAG: hypothetical protein DMF43_01920 [Verrucomicrobiota bacterium]
MKCAAVFLLVSIALASEGFGVLRPRFPIKAAPPFSGDVIIIGGDVTQNPAKTSLPKASK